MRKLIFGVTLILSLLVCSCGSAGGAVNNEEYGKDFDAAMASIDSMCANANTVMTINVVIWQEAGPENVATCLSSMLTWTGDRHEKMPGKTYIYYAITGTEPTGIDRISHSEFKEKCWPTIETYQNSYKELATQVETTKEEIKTFKDTYGDKKSKATDALMEYYMKSASYADAALNPTGSLMTYSASHTDYETQVAELKTKAEFEK